MKESPLELCVYVHKEGNCFWVGAAEYNEMIDSKWKGYEVLAESMGARKVSEAEKAEWLAGKETDKGVEEDNAAKAEGNSTDEEVKTPAPAKPAAPKRRTTAKKKTIRKSPAAS